MIVTIVNIALMILAIILPKWGSLAAVVASYLIPDAIPVIDEVVSSAFLIRKFLAISPDAEGKEVVRQVRSNLSADNVKNNLTTEAAMQKAIEMREVRNQINKGAESISVFGENRKHQ